MSLQTDKVVEVLSVEDSPADARLIEELFDGGKLNSRVTLVSDGAQALDYVFKRGKYSEAPTPDLILLDLNLPKKNGQEVLKEIKQHVHLRHIPILIFSTSDSEADVQMSYEHYANCFITKPADLDGFDLAMKRIEDFWLSTARLPHPAENLNHLWSP